MWQVAVILFCTEVPDPKRHQAMYQVMLPFLLYILNLLPISLIRLPDFGQWGVERDHFVCSTPGLCMFTSEPKVILLMVGTQAQES